MNYDFAKDEADAYANSSPAIDVLAHLRQRARGEMPTIRRSHADARTAALGFTEMLDHIERAIIADGALESVFMARFAARFQDAPAKVSLKPFPIDPGTVEASIWDNQPNGKATKVEGDSSRDRPARYALSLRACAAGHKTPLTTKAPDFTANVGDLFTAQEVRNRLRRAWKGMDEAEANFLKSVLLPKAEANGMLVARLCYKRSAKAGGGTHWHPYHYAMVSEGELAERAVTGIALIIGADPRAVFLPPCSSLDGAGKPFQQTTKTTKSGSVKVSVVVGQSRATDLTSAKMRAWATGAIAA